MSNGYEQDAAGSLEDSDECTATSPQKSRKVLLTIAAVVAVLALGAGVAVASVGGSDADAHTSEAGETALSAPNPEGWDSDMAEWAPNSATYVVDRAPTVLEDLLAANEDRDYDGFLEAANSGILLADEALQDPPPDTEAAATWTELWTEYKAAFQIAYVGFQGSDDWDAEFNSHLDAAMDAQEALTQRLAEMRQ